MIDIEVCVRLVGVLKTESMVTTGVRISVVLCADGIGEEVVGEWLCRHVVAREHACRT